MTRDDLKAFLSLDIDFSSIGLERGGESFSYFCTPMDAEHVGSIGCDGVHFVLLPGDERVFCVDPAMGEIGTFVLPVGGDFREFLSFVLYGRDANPLSQIHWMTEERFRGLLAEDAEARWPGCEEFFAKKDAALAAIAEAFGIAPADPFERVKALQAAFDPNVLEFSDEYYHVLGLENPRHPEEETVVQGTAFATVAFTFTKEEPMLPQDPNILLSYINTRLRDEYHSLDELYNALDADPMELAEKLSGLGFAYDPDANQFKPV